MNFNVNKLKGRATESFVWLASLLGTRKALELVEAQVGGQIGQYMPYIVTVAGIVGQGSKNSLVQKISTAAAIVGAEASLRAAITDQGTGLVKAGQLPQTIAKILPSSSGLGNLPAFTPSGMGSAIPFTPVEESMAVAAPAFAGF